MARGQRFPRDHTRYLEWLRAVQRETRGGVQAMAVKPLKGKLQHQDSVAMLLTVPGWKKQPCRT